MPLFKFGYVDLTLRYAELSLDARVELEFSLDHVPDAGDLDFSAVIALFEFDAVQPEYISFSVPQFLFEVELDDTLTSHIDIILSSVLFELSSESGVEINLAFSAPIFFDFDINAPLLNPAILSFSIPGVSPYLYTYAPSVISIDISVPSISFNMEAYFPVLGSLNINHSLPLFTFFFDQYDLQTVLFSIPDIEFSFHGFSGQSECSLDIRIPLSWFSFLCGHDVAQIDDGIIRFDYELHMFEILKSIQPDYEGLVIRFDVEQGS